MWASRIATLPGCVYLALLAVVVNQAQAQDAAVSFDGTYKLFNLTKMYLPLGVGLSYANISSNPAAFIAASGANLVGTMRETKNIQKSSTARSYPDPVTLSTDTKPPFFQGTSAVCAESIVFKVTPPNAVDFPAGLKDAAGKCVPIAGFTPTQNFLVDAGKMIGSFFMDENPPTYLKAQSQFRFAKVPNGTMVCPGVPSDTPRISQISINSLAQQLVAIIKASGIAMKIPLVILDKVFGKVRQTGSLARGAYPKGWTDSVLNVTKDGLRSELGKIKHIPMIILKSNPKVKPTKAFECFYVRETSDMKISNISDTIVEITEKIVPLMLQSTQKNIDLAGVSFYAADSRCDSSKAFSIANITFPATTTSLYPVSSLDVADVHVDGKACGKATKLGRLFDVEDMIDDTRSEMVGKKLVAFFNDNTRFSKMAGLMLDSVLGQLNALAPDGFAAKLQNSTTKTAILHTAIDVSKCDHIKDKSTVSVLIVRDYSAAGLFCKKFDGTPTPDTGCDGNLALQATHSALVIRDAKEIPQCIFSSNETVAAKFLAAVAPSPSPAAGSKNTTGDTGTPVTPKSNNASKPCFPASSTVLLSNGKYSTMKDLRVGDSIQVAPGVFEPILMFTHATPNFRSDMMVIKSTTGAELVASPRHLVYLNGRVIEAKEAKVGDNIMVSHGEELLPEIVTSVTVEQMVGLYNPQTPSGNILVHSGQGADTVTPGVLATTYTTVVPVTVAHSLLAPIRSVHSWFGAIIPAMSQFFPETDDVHQQRYKYIPMGASV